MKAGVLWTGGKDSSLAMYEAMVAGHRISGLVTFVPAEPVFLAHPLPLMALQASAIGLAHHAIEISKPYQECYERAIIDLRNRFDIDALITGDIAEVNGRPNWIAKCSRPSGLKVLSPLWGRHRGELLQKLIDSGFKVIFSCLKKPWFTENWLGRVIDMQSLARLKELSRRQGLDACGEQGEYHTMTLDGPIFQSEVCLDTVARRRHGDLMYLEISKASLRSKAAATQASFG